MTDDEFLYAFENCALDEFHHQDHIRMAWIYIRTCGYQNGSEKIRTGIRRFAAAKSANALYHETITEFWIRLVQYVIQSCPAERFEEFYSSFPPLQNSQSIFLHYTKDFLLSDRARNVWHNPDIHPMPM